MSRPSLPRLPLEVSVDLTYRCTNRCRHCWLWTADTPAERACELTTADWREVVDQARALGARRWCFSGGEPMLRADFAEVFDYATRKAMGYTLNTNGALITRELADLLTRKGAKMIAIYGATEEVHDRVTRAPGSFAATMEGFARLREAGAGFTVQLIPMRENWHEWDRMQELARSLSPHWRVGASWLFLTACGDAARNAEIVRQRLDPGDVVALDGPLPHGSGAGGSFCGVRDDRLYAACATTRRDLHIDPYGGVAHCCFVKDPELRSSLRDDDDGIHPGALERIWERRLPHVAGAVCGGREYLDGCGACELRGDCRWCGVYGYLEHRRHGARVEYLCEVAREARRSRADWRRAHLRTWQIGGMTVRVESERPIADETFSAKFRSFEAPDRNGRGAEATTAVAAEAPADVGADGLPVLHVRHHFRLPDLEGTELGEQMHRRPPWAIYRRGDSWAYLGISPTDDGTGAPTGVHRVATFSTDHTSGRVYSDAARADAWDRGGLESLTLLASDQILLARVLADRDGMYLHSGAVILGGAGICFVGHSEAGKSTAIELLRQRLGARVEVLCDDRNIVRYWPEGPPPVPSAATASAARPGFWVHGTWSHGTVPQVSAAQAPLRALVFLRQDERNELVPLADRRDVAGRILGCVIRPFVTADWWHKTLGVVERLVAAVPAYEMRFDKTGAIVPCIERVVDAADAADAADDGREARRR